MDSKDNRINQILSYLAKAASTAADGVSDVVQQAGSAVGQRYSGLKLTIELNRLHDEQAKLFENIGKTMFMLKSGAFETERHDEEGNLIDAQDTIDKLLGLAQDKQDEIDKVSAKLAASTGGKVCVVCGKTADTSDLYCAACGAKLPAEPKDNDAPGDGSCECGCGDEHTGDDDA